MKSVLSLQSLESVLSDAGAVGLNSSVSVNCGSAEQLA